MRPSIVMRRVTKLLVDGKKVAQVENRVMLWISMSPTKKVCDVSHLHHFCFLEAFDCWISNPDLMAQRKLQVGKLYCRKIEIITTMLKRFILKPLSLCRKVGLLFHRFPAYSQRILKL